MDHNYDHLSFTSIESLSLKNKKILYTQYTEKDNMEKTQVEKKARATRVILLG